MSNKYFHRETTSGNFIPEIDGLRAFALIMVFFFHFNGFLFFYSAHYSESLGFWGKLLFSNGDNGVALFFTISAFILTLPLATKLLNQRDYKINYTNYLKRRFSRLHPTYLITLTIFALYFYLFKSLSGRDVLESFLAGNLYIHNIWYNHANSLNYVLWSLEIEFQFYLLLPFLIQIFKLTPSLRRLILISFMIITPFVRDYIPYTNVLTILNHFQFFLAGMLLADLFMIRDNLKHKVLHVYRQRSNLELLIFIVLLIFFFANHLHSQVVLRLVAPIIALILVGLVLTNKFLSSFFSSKYLVYLGTASYTGYLIHFQLISGSRLFFSSLNLSLNTPLILYSTIILLPLIVFVVVLGAFVFIEHPFMKPNWYISKKPNL